MFSFTFGIPPVDVIASIKDAGMRFFGTATTVEEAKLLADAGAEGVVVQGSEAGAHRGTFATDFESGMVGTIALVPQVVDAVSLPVSASGGIMDGRGIAAALALGAQAVQLGTAFLTTTETAIPAAYKQAIPMSSADQTKVTRAFSGRPARGIVNEFMEALDRRQQDILPYPYQNSLTRPMRTEAARRGERDFLSLWAGQGAALARTGSASTLVADLVTETRAAIARLSTLVD